MELTPYNLAQRALTEIDKAEGARMKAEARKEAIRKTVDIELGLRYSRRGGPTHAELVSVTDSRASNDPSFKRHVSANQWHLQQAMAFNAAAEAAKTIREENAKTRRSNWSPFAGDDLSCGSL